MALEVGSRPQQSANARVLVSELHELNFALFLLQCHDIRHGHEAPAWVAEFERDHPDLYNRIRTFWADRERATKTGGLTDSGYFAWDEMFVLAHHTGTLRDATLDRFFERLPGALERELVVPPLPTETPDVPGLVERRFKALRESPELRDAYVSMMREAWDALRPRWQSELSGAATQAAREFVGQPATLEELWRLVPGCSMLRREDYEDIVRGALERNEVVIVPLALAGDGQCLFYLPGTLLIGVGLEAGEKLERKRAMAERVAGRLKVLSDPTRVAMLMHLMHKPSTITELANYFELSQPTVSVHMKALREADLLRAEKTGTKTKYHASGGEVRKYVEMALQDMGTDHSSV